MNQDQQKILDQLKVLPKKKDEDEDAEKWPKQASLYLFKQDLHYSCIECQFWKNGCKCALYGPSVSIKSYGGCGLWVEKVKVGEIPFIGAVTKLESGYMESEVGFSCGKCEYFSGNDCERVDKDSPGDTPNKILSGACCNRWSGKK